MLHKKVPAKTAGTQKIFGFICASQLAGLKAVAGQHHHTGKAGLAGSLGGFVKISRQGVGAVRIRGDDHIAAQLMPFGQQEVGGVEILADPARNLTGVDLQQLAACKGLFQRVQGSLLIAGRSFIKE